MGKKKEQTNGVLFFFLSFFHFSISSFHSYLFRKWEMEFRGFLFLHLFLFFCFCLYCFFIFIFEKDDMRI